MSVFDNAEIRDRLVTAFPRLLVNRHADTV